MLDKMKQMMEMKKQAEQIKRELDTTVVESEDIKGFKIIMNGSQEVQSIEIDEELVSAQSKQSFEADLVRSINAAIKKSQNVATQKMKEILPGFPGMT